MTPETYEAIRKGLEQIATTNSIYWPEKCQTNVRLARELLSQLDSQPKVIQEEFIGHVTKLVGHADYVQVHIQTDADKCGQEVVINVLQNEARHWIPGTRVEAKIAPLGRAE